ncbi:3-hydroxyacyl-CoA dehydrogenase [Halomonas campisalis]|uniref:3-hydroxyacyl-CoA dehydrogenase n=1 Tax=Billgrantia campisalis TaxID=74661 RepID=A0ABS9P5E3_9GAMM|nr:3-hydroxyacyl-CoA dehydrogenase NAD-binding domain-containing protein [Halomonas campisalis]MCG6656979.1 3-hydroxyacyl-CoA dehydrogenase [Halomonas campisalis]MDR5862166.1 3-hydroxyacyl-CoA dehydrogenase NAD-binding domain-containing protein [Halomonas campisalis]
MTEPVHYQQIGRIAVLRMNQPPINALGHAMRTALQAAYQRAISDDAVAAIVLLSDIGIFCGGADIGEFGTEAVRQPPSLPELCSTLDQSPKPIVAALHGTALGGGLEIALGCDYRIATPQTRLGLPEVNIGLVPGAGGTQRLPRLVGVPAALEMITSGQPIPAAKAHEIGLLDRLVEGDLLTAAVHFAEELISTSAPLRSCTTLSVDTRTLSPSHFDDFRASIARKTRGFVAPERCIQAVEAACRLPLAEGLKKEHDLFLECMATPQARAQQHLFFSERKATKVPNVSPQATARRIERVAIIGAGTMGGGIAMNFANAGIPVKLLELKQEALDKGLAAIRNNYLISAKKGRMTEAQVEQRMALLEGTLHYNDLADADLVIEAAFESMDIKRTIFTKLDEVCKPGAILASNTSTLDLNEIASATRRPQDVIGLHFFSPANVMRLLEIIRGSATSDEAIVTALKMAKIIRKVPVVVGVCFGFVGNRMLEPYGREAHRLLLEGATPAQIDRALTRFGMAMGPCSMFDLAGNDVGYLVRESRRGDIAHDPSYNLIGDRLYALGRYGQKSGRGFYRYENREQLEDPDVIELAETIAKELGIERRAIEDEEIVERCIFSLINEGAAILDEGIAYRSSDCDLVWVNGYGFPVWRGGPMHYADEIGLDTVLAGIERYRSRLGTHGETWFTPSPLLERLVAEGRRFGDALTQVAANTR